MLVTRSKRGAMAKKNTKTFETSMNELEKILNELESGELELAKSLDLFEKGVNLYKDCKGQLSVVEKKISELTESLKEEEIVDNE